MSEDKILTPKQEQFCLLYHNSSNATQSYLKSYPTENIRTAQKNGHRLLKQPYIRKRLQELQDETMKEFKVTRDELIKLNVAVAFSKLSDVIEITEDGEIELKPDGDIDQLESIGFSVSSSHSSNKDGESSSKSKSISVKRPDRVKAAQELAKLIGAYSDGGTDGDDKKEGALKLIESLMKFKKKKDE